MSDSGNRRDLLKAGGILLLQPKTVFGSQANSTVELGLIGCGGRGNWISPLFIEHTGARFVATADVVKSKLDSTSAKLTWRQGAPTTGRMPTGNWRTRRWTRW